jgi:hypothetical protein
MAAVKPRTVKWLQFVVAVSFATVPLFTIFFHLLLYPLLDLCCSQLCPQTQHILDVTKGELPFVQKHFLPLLPPFLIHPHRF